jgi:DNA-binding CsgD family transcriptional regulator
MAAFGVMGGRAVELRGRRSECAVFDALLARMRGGESGVLVVHGEAGVGKTALLEYAVESASDMRVLRAAGVESEMEVPFAALHQLCAPMLSRLSELPGPQRDALATVFGLMVGATPGRLLVGLALLSLLSGAADERPVLCVVDDAQWLDRASAQAMAFATRRLLAESVVVLFAVRKPGDQLRGLPELEIRGLRNRDARELLASVVPGPLDERVLEQIVAETRGNPLALIELPRGLSPAQLAGGFGLPGAPLSDRIEESFRRRLNDLGEEPQRLMLVAAAEPLGDPDLLWHAATELGTGREALMAAQAAGLLEVGDRVTFRHPLVRSAVYRSAPLSECQRVHAALANATDPEVDPDRRAWHRAAAAAGPDEEVAAELERSAGRARQRGGLAAAAAFLERSVALTREPARRADRALAAAEANLQAGALEAALRLLATAEEGLIDELGRARADLVRARVAMASKHGSDAPPLLLKAARRFEELDLCLARETYRDAFYAALLVGRLNAGVGVLEVAGAARAVSPAPAAPGASDLLLDGLTALTIGGYAAGAPMLRRAVSAFRDEIPTEGGIGWLPLACKMSHDVWDDESWNVLSARLVELARDDGALTLLPTALSLRVGFTLFAGEFATVESLAEESEAVSEVTRSDLAPYGAAVRLGSSVRAGLWLAAWRGREHETSRLIEAVTKEIMARGEGQWLTATYWATAVLYNGLGRFEEARVAAERAREYPLELGVSNWALVELVEAAARSGQTELAVETVQRLSEMAHAAGTDWALGNKACARALIGDRETAEALYLDAIERLGRTRIRVQLARAHLLYGEWLRRERRRQDARVQLRTAHQMFDRIGMEAFAQRAERELLATGERARKRTLATIDQLTAQELQVAQMARDGLSNPEIGARLFISRRTVKYHLQKVFTKLEITSRGELNRALRASDN